MKKEYHYAESGLTQIRGRRECRSIVRPCGKLDYVQCRFGCRIRGAQASPRSAAANRCCCKATRMRRKPPIGLKPQPVA